MSDDLTEHPLYRNGSTVEMAEEMAALQVVMRTQVTNTIDDCERVAINALNSVMTNVPPIILAKLQDELNRGFAQARERANERLRS